MDAAPLPALGEATTTPPVHDFVTKVNLDDKFIKNQFNNYIVREDYVPRVLRNPSLAKRSRILCYLLRWGAKNAGIQMSSDGYVMVEDLLSSGYFIDSSLDDIKKIVELDDKERFSMATDEASGKPKVRANHGHGIPGIVVTDRKLTARDVPGAVIHLTTQDVQPVPTTGRPIHSCASHSFCS